jgi:aspartate racemase
LKRLGIIGGLGPESTVEFYKEIISAYKERVPDGSQPEFIINSVNMKTLVDAVTVNDFETMTHYLIEQIELLAKAGCEFAIISANTPHLVFDEVQRRSPIPLISIVEAAAAATKARGLKKVGLFGTRFTMKAPLFPEVFARKDIQIVTPNDEEKEFVHDIYMNELVKGVIRDETRARLLTIAGRMKIDDGIEGLLLGGTELSLIIKNLDGTGLELLDTMKIQVQAAIAEMLS